MKIGFVSLMRFAPWGGSEELWSKTALLALAEGHTVETLTYGWESESPHIAQLRQAGADTKFFYGDSPALLDRAAVRLALKTRRSAQVPPLTADVLVVSNGAVWDFLGLRTVLDQLLRLQKPYLLLIHNALDAGENLAEEPRAYAIEVMQGAAHRLFVSERNREAAERQMAANVGPYRVVSNPINTRTVAVQPYPESDKLLMACVASLTCHSKGQDTLLEALSSPVWQNRAFELKLYGSGPDNAYLERLIAFYGLQDKVMLQGHVHDVDHIWQTSQVLVLPSVFEGVPMVVVEAMLAGRAVVGTDVGAVELYVLEDETGFLVPAAKAKYLAAGLEKLWNNRAKLKQMGEQAFHRTSSLRDFHPEESFLSLIKGAAR